MGLEGIKKFVLETIAKIGLTRPVVGASRPRGALTRPFAELRWRLDQKSKTAFLARDLAITRKPTTGKQVITAPGRCLFGNNQFTFVCFRGSHPVNQNGRRSEHQTKSGAQVIGFTSSVPNEGKSSVASAVARLTAQTGAKTLLVDCDLRNPSLSRCWRLTRRPGCWKS